MAKGRKKPAKRPAAKASASPRTRKLTRTQERQKAKKEVRSNAPLPGSFRLTAEVFKTLRRWWRPLAGIVVVYAILNIIFASSLIGNIDSKAHDIKNNLHPTSGQHVNKFSNAVNGFGSLVSGVNGSSSSTTMQAILLVLESLIIIWALRHLLAGERIRVKQAYYHATAQLIPFLLVILVIIIQLLPLTLGTALLALVLSSAFINATLVNVIFSTFFVIVAAWTFYMISSSVFALYIVTLPDMEPRKALRAAKNLARFRRWKLVRKVMFLPLFLLIVGGVVIVPLILWAGFLVTPVFFVLMMLGILYSHTYLYSLYRNMIA